MGRWVSTNRVPWCPAATLGCLCEGATLKENANLVWSSVAKMLDQDQKRRREGHLATFLAHRSGRGRVAAVD